MLKRARNYSTATQGSAETMHFSGLPTPASLTKSASSAESLHLLAKLLSPLRSRASTGESLNKQAIWENFETQTTPPYAPQSDVHPPWHAGYNILPSESSTLYRTSTQGTRMGFTAESSNGQPEFPIAPLRSWGKLKAHDCFDVYKPTVASIEYFGSFPDAYTT